MPRHDPPVEMAVSVDRHEMHNLYYEENPYDSAWPNGIRTINKTAMAQEAIHSLRRLCISRQWRYPKL